MERKKNDDFTWLHISDIHQGMDGHEDKQLTVYSDLLKHIRFWIETTEPPNCVFVTGDIAQGGTKAQYTDVQRDLFTPLSALLPHAKFITVPGNHDLDRSRIDYRAVVRASYSEALSPSIKETSQFFQRRKTMNECFRAYADWDSALSNFEGEHWIMQASGTRAHQPMPTEAPDLWIIQINTAWLAWGADGNVNYDENGLSCGRQLVAAVFRKIPHGAKCIILGHHPLQWLEKECKEDLEMLLGEHNALYLHGHMHIPDAGRGAKFQEYISIQGAALYQEFNNNMEPNGVIWGRVEFASGTLSLHPVVRKDRFWKRGETISGFASQGGWDTRPLPQQQGHGSPPPPPPPLATRKSETPLTLAQTTLENLDALSRATDQFELSEGDYFDEATKLILQFPDAGQYPKFAYLLEIDTDPPAFDTTIRNQLEGLRQTSRDFLVAHFLIGLLGETTHQSRGRGDVYEAHSNVYPKRVNRYCKIAIEKHKNQQHLLKSLIAIYELAHKKKYGKEHLKFTRVKTNICYLIGRLTSKPVRLIAKNTLLKWDANFRSLHGLPALRNSTEGSDENIDRQKSKEQGYLENSNADRLLYRTIQISLIQLDTPRASDSYIELCLSSKKLDDFNRGFHLEYYGDVEYIRSQPMANIDELGTCTKTFNTLIKKIEDSFKSQLSYTLRDIDLYTLVSLAQHRHSIGRLDHDKRMRLLSILENKNGASEFPALREYCSFVYDHLLQEHFRPQSIIEEIYSLKKTSRQGWIANGRKVAKPESIASHVAGGMWLIYFHLPKTGSKEAKDLGSGYSQEKVIQLFLIHDLAEARLGDLLPAEKNEEAGSKEHEYFRKLTHTGTYDGYSNTTLLADWEEFEFGTNCNGRLARDIDKLENLQQLLIEIKEDIDAIPDTTEWVQYLCKRLLTEEGKRIAKLMLDGTRLAHNLH